MTTDDETVAAGKRRPANEPAQPDGSTLVANRYQIVRWLGGGGMGRVYEAIDTELGARVGWA